MDRVEPEYGRGSRADDELSTWERRLAAEAARHAANGDGSHDVGHARRVWALCGRIADGLDEPVHRLVLLAGAYLHDAMPVEKNDPRRAQASRAAAEYATSFLTAAGFPRDLLGAVAHAIEAHSYSAGVPPASAEARVLQDADRLEALGAIGLARTFYVAGRMGSSLFHAEDPLAQARRLDDRRYALDHFQAKLYRLPGTMQTAPGRAIARERVAVLERFVEDLLAELGPLP